MKFVFRDRAFSFEALRAVGHAVYGGADTGECLATAYRIEEGDLESWHREWAGTAFRVRTIADESLARGHTVSAREAYLRASNYYRTAEFFLHVDPTDPRIRTTWESSVECFGRAAGLFSPRFEAVEIPYEGTTLPGYFYRVDESGASRLTLILHGGFDSTLEELYFFGAAAALRRGYNCLAFDGPGQGRVIRRQKLPFRPDWEKVVTPVIDHALSRPEVDSSRMALMGVSLGGYLAARAAAFEPRIAACVLFNGLFDLHAAALDQAPGFMRRQVEKGDTPLVNAAGRTMMRLDTTRRWSLTHGMWAYGASSPGEFIRMTADYTLEGVAGRISCPTLVLDSEKDHFFPGQAPKVYEALTAPKKYVLFTVNEGAGEHCQVGAMSLTHQRVFDWLDETLVRRM